MDGEGGQAGVSRPTVSVLMTVYNTRAYLPEAIESILGQTLRDLELIIIDDCSTDGSCEVLRAYAARDDRIQTMRTGRNLGAGGALNLGLSRARGMYLTRQDSDDRSLPDRLRMQVSVLEADEQVGAVGVCPRLIDVSGRALQLAPFPLTDEEIQSMLLDRMCFCGPTVMVRRSSFEQAGFWFDEALSGSEDYDLCLRLAEVTRLANVAPPLYEYRQHPDSISRLQRPQQLVRKALALERAIHRRFGADAPSDLRRYVARDYLRAAVVFRAAGEPAGALHCLRRALDRDAGLLEDVRLVEDVVRKYTPRDPLDVALRFTAGIFDDLLPATRRLTKLKSRLLSELHMAEAFAGGSPRKGTGVGEHLRAGLRLDVSWLGNPGVWSLLLKHTILRRGQ